MNRLDLGLLGGLGSFSYLYVFKEPYAKRAKKIFFVVLGITLSVALGTLTAPYPVLIIIIVGLIGFTATFIFGVLKIPGPSAIFFILTFLASTSMTIDPKAAPLRALVVFFSGLFSWTMSMIGYLFNPHCTENKALKEIYIALADFSELSDNAEHARHRTVVALKELNETLLEGYIPWKNVQNFNKLSLLNDQANKLFFEMLELYHENVKITSEVSESVRKLARGIAQKGEEHVHINILNQKKEFNRLIRIIYETEKIIKKPLKDFKYKNKFLKHSIKVKIIQAFDKESIIFINSVRYGIVLMISAIVAYAFPFERRYWIPLTCASVMLGSTIMSTFNRAIQRTCGTFLGILIATIVFKMNPQSYMIAIITMVLTLLTELFIVKNYAIAAIFITPNALVIAEASMQLHDMSFYAITRITATFVGALIGLLGTYFLGQKSASSRLPVLMSKVIRSQGQVLAGLSYNNDNYKLKWINEKMEMDLRNFDTAYKTALGETFNNKELIEKMWAALFSIEHLGYLIYRRCLKKESLNLSNVNLEILLNALEGIAVSVEQKQIVEIKKVPIFKEAPSICREINRLQEAVFIEQF